MNGTANGHAHATPKPNDNSELLPRLQEALGLVHNPYSPNDARKQASLWLEEVKANDEAPYHGFTLACDKSQTPVVRHYALSLLEYAIRHRWTEYSEDQEAVVRGWVLRLSQEITNDDPLYLRNKTAQLWVEIAKRSWATTWNDMDELLLRLWENPSGVVHKEFVLFVLETLSEEVFNGEDTVAALREAVLSKACVEIFTPATVLAEAFPNRQAGAGVGVRYGDDGWLVRLGQLLSQCLQNDVQNNEQYRTCAVKTLAVFRSVMTWAIPKAVVAASCVQRMCEALATASVKVQMASVEALHSLYCRTHFSDEEFLQLVCPMYTGEVVGLLGKLFAWSAVDPNDIDDEKYLFSKKFSEMMSNLGNFVEQKISTIPDDCDLPNLLNLFLAIVRSESFVVSIPVLVTWQRLLRSSTICGSPTLTPMIEPLLQVCSSRLIRYESLPEDSDDPSLIFLHEDIDTIPERHAFLGNYRRYSVSVIETIVRYKQADALYHILTQVDESMRHLYDGQAPFSLATYNKNSLPVLRADAQVTIVEAALKGYMKWRSVSGTKSSLSDQERASIEGNLEAWCNRILCLSFEDPLIRKRVLQLAVAFSTSALDKNIGFMLKVLENILMTTVVEQPEYRAYSDAVKELQSDCLHELQRLATKMPDHLLDVYDQLEATINNIVASGALDGKQQVSYQTFLFIIIHRAQKLSPETRMQRLDRFIAPIRQMWRNQALDESLATFNGFCEMIGLGKVREYLISRRVHEVQDWAGLPLDADGQAIQAQLNENVKQLPLRYTRSFLGCSTDRVDRGTPEHKISCAIWQESMPLILPGLLKFLSHAHAFHNPTNWLGLPDEMQSIVGRILTDRFWQAGISEGSKDDFYARVTGTKTTMEGFASSIRGSVRNVREQCYSILFCMSRLDLDFYGFSELPEPLAQALFADAHYLSSHQLNNLLNLVRYMIDDCPAEIRPHFLPPILATCFSTMDSKIDSEWSKISQNEATASPGADLTEEMKEESILRQLTYAAVMMVAGVLDPARANHPAPSKTGDEKGLVVVKAPEAKGPSYPTMRRFCLTTMAILEPLLLFCTHAICMRDTRCCNVVLRVFRSILPDAGSTQPEHALGPDSTMRPIREYIATDVLKACITSLHEPYFVDLQKDLAQVIAGILVWVGRHTDTPKQILLSLPGIQEHDVKYCIEHLNRPGTQQRQQRALVLDLLKHLKGVSISEQGRVTKPAGDVRRERSKMQQEFMKVHPAEEVRRGPSPSLEGVAGMFDE